MKNKPIALRLSLPRSIFVFCKGVDAPGYAVLRGYPHDPTRISSQPRDDILAALRGRPRREPSLRTRARLYNKVSKCRMLLHL